MYWSCSDNIYMGISIWDINDIHIDSDRHLSPEWGFLMLPLIDGETAVNGECGSFHSLLWEFWIWPSKLEPTFCAINVSDGNTHLRWAIMHAATDKLNEFSKLEDQDGAHTSQAQSQGSTVHRLSKKEIQILKMHRWCV